VTGNEEKTINGHTFTAIGIKRQDIDTFCVRLDKVLSKLYSNKPSCDNFL